MEPRPIDANALVARFEELKNNPNNSLIDVIFLDGAMSVVDAASTLDYEPVRHGEWIPLEEPQWNCFGLVTIGYRCSECGREEPYNNEPYCHCGAKMDAKEE